MNKKVLVSNHDESLMSIIQFVLEEEGYETKSCKAKNIALVAGKYLPSLILLDEGLLQNSASATRCKELKMNFRTANIPIILLSTSASILKDASAVCGAAGFLLEPFELQDLYDMVKQLKTE